MPRRSDHPGPTLEDTFGPTEGEPSTQYLAVIEWVRKDMGVAEWHADRLGRNRNPQLAFPFITFSVLPGNEVRPWLKKVGLAAVQKGMPLALQQGWVTGVDE
ncbi:hypothetical protein [Mesoterricola sediminis]|uniref:Uncharacterized protein n=1 Tax=Mesoterricola sediminis TaxID=2927980 RepID=A0AA48GTH4_9BACT|nr:hypothetical protein [Mesoterricola sediminis]BDU77439.1 hypothetical protein METESE_23970 [Mesoterricola sediminis]